MWISGHGYMLTLFFGWSITGDKILRYLDLCLIANRITGSLLSNALFVRDIVTLHYLHKTGLLCFGADSIILVYSINTL